MPADNSAALKDVSLLINNNSGKSLDVPNGTLEPGTRVVQYESNYRFNQRWRFVKKGNAYMIENCLSKQCLDIAGEKTEGGSAVVQWEKTGNNNQLWRVE